MLKRAEGIVVSYKVIFDRVMDSSFKNGLYSVESILDLSILIFL
jgi:hypothetical protein